MFGAFLRWGIPGLVTVVGGTALTVAMTAENMASDLGARTSQALEGDAYRWATVTMIGRDAVVSGTAGDQRTVDLVVARLAALHGVRSVNADVAIAELASPFIVSGTVGEGGIALAGGVPDEETRAELVAELPLAADSLRLMAGAPDTATWRAALDFGLAHLAGFDEGSFSLADLAISISGRARSRDEFDALLKLEETVPEGITIASLQVMPPLATPYELSATFDGIAMAVSGFAPSEAFVSELQAGDIVDVPVSTSLLLASGAPADFEQRAKTLLQNLAKLENGTASITDGNARLDGAPPSAETAESVRVALSPVLRDLSLQPPRIDNYIFSATRRGDAIVLNGFVPDADTRDRLDAIDKVEAGALELARGEPDRFHAAVDFGLDILARLSEGAFAIDGTLLSFDGRAATSADFEAIEETLALGPPQALILARAAVLPPLAEPFTWSATRRLDGTVAIAGFVPADKIRRALQAATTSLVSDGTAVADGAPAGFEDSARSGLALLPLLDTGSVAFDGTSWSLTGTVTTAGKGDALKAAFEAAGLPAAGWTYAIEAPEAPAVAELPLEPEPEVAPAAPETPAETSEPETPADAPTEPAPVAEEPAPEPPATELETALVEPAEADPVVPSEPESPPEVTDVAAAPEPVVPVEEPAAAPVIRDFIFEATKPLDAPVVLIGQVPAAEAQAFFGTSAGDVPTDRMVVASGLPPDFVANAEAGLGLLAGLDEGSLGFDGRLWVLNGRVESEARRVALQQSLAAKPETAGWVTDITLIPPLDICRRGVAGFAARNAIVFRPGSAQIAEESGPAIDELVNLLAACPEASVSVEGHTDSDGDDESNLALSVSRAEAVVNALIDRGVAFQRLYAVGYGESLPIADNTTNAGKQANRRIGFTLEDSQQ